MKTILAIGLLLAFTLTPAFDRDGRFLNRVILDLPARYFGDVPRENRAFILKRLSDVPYYNRQLDYEYGYLHWFTDGALAEESAITGIPGATSVFWVKLLPREGTFPLVFVHMAKPISSATDRIEANQTYVFQAEGNEWLDVTADVIPAEVDRTLHFRPRRTDNVIELASYEKFERRDGQGTAIRFGPRVLDLVWEDEQFHVRKPDGEKLSWDSKIIRKD